VEASDLFATIVSLAGAPQAGTGVDAQSLLPLLNGTVDTSRTVLAEVFGGGTTPSNSGRSLRDTRYKLIEFNDGMREFYDLQTDPYESTNLLAGTMSAGQQGAYYQLRMQIAAYQDTLVSPVISSWSRAAGQFAVTVQHGAGYSSTLWRASDLSGLTWAPLTNALITTNSSTSTTLVDPAATNASACYRVETVAP
jgi:arylsulfatase A-like enzyme